MLKIKKYFFARNNKKASFSFEKEACENKPVFTYFLDAADFACSLAMALTPQAFLVAAGQLLWVQQLVLHLAAVIGQHLAALFVELAARATVAVATAMIVIAMIFFIIYQGVRLL